MQQMRRLQRRVDALNAELFNPSGLNILWPRKVAFMFVRALSHSALLHQGSPSLDIDHLARDRVLRESARF